MFWGLDGGILKWDSSSKTLVLQRMPNSTEEQITRVKNFAKAFKILHSSVISQSDSSIFLTSCQEYAKLLEDNEIGYPLFKLLESFILSYKTTNVKKPFNTSLRHFTENLPSTDVAKVIHSLICVQDPKFVELYQSKGGSELVGSYLTTVYAATNIDAWRDYFSELSKSSEFTDFDKNIQDFINNDEYDLGNWKLNTAAKLAFHFNTITKSELSALCLPQIQNEDPKSLDYLIKLMIQSDFSMLINIIYARTNDELISMHFIDILYTVYENGKNYRKNPVEPARSLAIRRYVEFLLSDSTLANEAVLYLKNIQNGENLIELLMPYIKNQLNSVTMGSLNNIKKFECEFSEKHYIFELLENARKESMESAIQVINDEFLHCNVHEQEVVVNENEDLFVSDLEISNNVLPAILSVAKSPRVKDAITKRLFKLIESNFVIQSFA